MPKVEERSRYQSDFDVSWLRLPALIVGALMTALAIALCLKFAFDLGWYLVILLPAVGGLALGSVLHLLVGWTHCRNYWLSASIGVVAGLIAYLGYYHFCLMDLLPPGNAWRVDLLPRFVALRMKTDVVKEVGKPDLNPQANKATAPLNYFAFGLELLMVVGCAATFSWKRARQAYCVELGQWMQRDTAMLAPHSSANFRAALDTDTLPKFVANTAAGNDPQTASRLILEYAVPETGSALEFPIYASFEDFPRRRLRRTVIRQIEMELAEVLALRPLFPKMTRLLETQHSELRDLPAEALADPSPSVAASDRAETTPVADPYRKRVQGKGYALRVNLIGLTPLIYLLIGMGAVAGGVWLLKFLSIPLGCAAIVVGAASFVWGIYISQYCISVPENRSIERRLRREIAQRPEMLVDPQDPESIFVSLIPRESFSKIKWTMASDVLLLKLDKSRRRLLLEGDSDRYRIPAGAISVCEPQCFFHPIDRERKKQLWMVRLMIDLEQGARELLLSVNQTHWEPMTNARRRLVAEDMCRRIAELRGPSAQL